LTALRVRLVAPDPWLGGLGADTFGDMLAMAENFIEIRGDKTALAQGPVVVAYDRAEVFLAAFLAAVSRGLPVALASPRWGEIERTQAVLQMRPGLWLGDDSARWPKMTPGCSYDPAAWSGAILIPTGGTGGGVRWAIHTWETLTAAARALAVFLDAEGCTHVSTLPPWHVSGLMPAVRALATGGKLWLEDWKILEAGNPPKISPERAIISLVPTQLRRLLERPAVVEWLRATRAILIGGAEASPDLLARARELRLPIALAYGMTETAAVVAAQTPSDFLAGEPPRVTALPHAKLWVGDDAAQPAEIEKSGRVWIEAESLFAGYFPKRRLPGPFGTEDNGARDEQGRLRLLGRLDRVIITGGEKVDPRVVEAALKETGLVESARVIGLPDADWGERVAAFYVGPPRTETELRAALASRLAAHAIPKTWIHLERFADTADKKFSAYE
jgi:O-succinylbenzoic acid--CoA ligase